MRVTSKQVIDEPRLQGGIAADDLQLLMGVCVELRVISKHCSCRKYWIERVTQLMTEHSHEVVLGLTRTFGRLVGAFRADFCLLDCAKLVNINRGAGPLGNVPLRIANGRRAAEVPSPLPIGKAQAMLTWNSSPVSTDFCQAVTVRSTSSGCSAPVHSQAPSSRCWKPWYWLIRSLKKSMVPSARAVHAIAGMVSASWRARSSLCRRSSSACLSTVISANVATTPSMMLSTVRDGRMRTRYHDCESGMCTCRSLMTSV